MSYDKLSIQLKIAQMFLRSARSPDTVDKKYELILLKQVLIEIMKLVEDEINAV
jgi:hypothetical protein